MPELISQSLFGTFVAFAAAVAAAFLGAVFVKGLELFAAFDFEEAEAFRVHGAFVRKHKR